MKKKILIIATSQLTIKSFLLLHINNLKKKYDVTILTKFSSKNFVIPKVKILNIDIKRKIDILSDLKNLFYIFNFIRLNNFNLIFTITPKAGLLGIVGAYFNRTPFRIHIFTGQVWSNKNSLYKIFLKFFDKIIVKFSTDILCDSVSQKKFLISNSFTKNIKVIGNGSICGVNTNYFKPNIYQKNKLKKIFSINKNETTFIYVGRINEDKGIYNLIQVQKLLLRSNYKVKFFLIGTIEDSNLKSEIERCKNLFHINHTNKIKKFYQLGDIYITSSFREGFGVSVAQAMACSLPVIGTNIYGYKDLLKNKKNALIYKPNDIRKLYKCCIELIENKRLRNKLGVSGRKKISKKFQEKDLVKKYENFFKMKLS